MSEGISGSVTVYSPENVRAALAGGDRPSTHNRSRVSCVRSRLQGGPAAGQTRAPCSMETKGKASSRVSRSIADLVAGHHNTRESTTGNVAVMKDEW